MKKKLVVLFALLLTVVLLFAACGDKTPSEQHTHEFGEWIAVVEATCTEAGTKGHYHCSGCNKDFDSSKNEITDLVIPAAGHTPGEWFVTTEATCSAEGSRYQVCSVCAETIKTEAIPTLAHTEVTDVAVAATCTTPGKTEGKHCSVCNTVIAAQDEIPALGHTPAERADEENRVEATCTTPGSYDLVVYCIACGDELSRTTVEIPAIGQHQYEHDEEVPATCDHAGVLAHYHCPVCGTLFNEEKEEVTAEELAIPTVAHTMETVSGTPASCDQPGEKPHSHCSVCGKDFDEEGNELTDLTIPASHAYVFVESYSTFSEVKKDSHYECTLCGRIFDKNKNEVASIDDLPDASMIAISTAEDLQTLAANVRNGETYAGKTFVLTNDINLSGKSWTSIGTRGNGDAKRAFKGTFDGQGHTIKLDSTTQTQSEGGLFGYVSGNAVIQNLKLTGTIQVKGEVSGGYYGSLIGCVGEGNIQISNVWSNVSFNVKGWFRDSSGFIGGFDHFITVTLTCTDCLYDGTITTPQTNVQDSGGLLGFTGRGNGSNTKTIIMNRCVFAGTWLSNGSWHDENGLILGYMQNNSNETPVLKVVLTDCIVCGKYSFTGNTDKKVASIIGWAGKSNSNTSYTMENVYYIPSIKAGNELPAYCGDAVNSYPATKVKAKDLVGLTETAFSSEEGWVIDGENYPCPAAILEIFGQPESLKVDPVDLVDEFEVATAEELISIANNVNKGSTYAGKTVKLVADIDLTDTGWRSIGTRGNGDAKMAFKGTFDGQGHTVNLKSYTGEQSEGGLFGFLGDGAVVMNVRLTGEIHLQKDLQVGCYGSLVGCCAGAVKISNVWSSVNIHTDAKWFKYCGGMIGIIDNNANSNLNVSDCVYDGHIYASASVQESGGFFGYSGLIADNITKSITFTRCVFAGTFQTNASQGYHEDTGLFLGYQQNNSNNKGKLTVTLTDCIVSGHFTFGEKSAGVTKNCAIVIGWAGFQNEATSYTMTNVYYLPGNYPNGTAIAAYNSTGGREIPGATAKTLDEIKALTAEDFANGNAWVFTDGKTPRPKAIADLFD